MICLYQHPDKTMLRVSTSDNFHGAKKLDPLDPLWGGRAGDLAEGVYTDSGKFLGSFDDYWQREQPKPKLISWVQRLLGGR